MARQASDARDAHTTGHTSGRNPGVVVTGRGKPRRRWTAEQKRQIVAESLEPGASAATVAARHGISSGQFYAWRQQLLLRGALGAAAETTARPVRGDVTMIAPRPEASVSAPPEPDIPAAAVVPAAPAQPDAASMLPGGVPAPANEGLVVERSSMAGRGSALNRPELTNWPPGTNNGTKHEHQAALANGVGGVRSGLNPSPVSAVLRSVTQT